jgi:hypothetical protein
MLFYARSPPHVNLRKVDGAEARRWRVPIPRHNVRGVETESANSRHNSLLGKLKPAMILLHRPMILHRPMKLHRPVGN